MSIELGALFPTFQDFTLALKKHEKDCDQIGSWGRWKLRKPVSVANGILWDCVTSTLHSRLYFTPTKLNKELPFADTLKYEYVRYACKQGCLRRKSSSAGIRPNQKTFKTGCPALINLLHVEDGDAYKLKITLCNLVHENHPTGQEFSRLYPENRRQKFKLTRRPNISGAHKLKGALSLSTELVCDSKKSKLSKNSFQKICLDSMKIKYNTKHNSDMVNAIQNDLTPSAAKLVTEQFLLSQQTRYLYQSLPTCPDMYKVTSTTHSGGCHYNCTAHSCSCDFFMKFHQACQHIFALRSELGLPLYYCGTGNEQSKSDHSSSSTSTKVQSIKPEVVPARHDSSKESRCHMTKEITQAIESVLPLLGEHSFQTAIANLNKVLTLIKSGRPMAVIDLSEHITPPTQTNPDNMCSTVSKLPSETKTLYSAKENESINVVVEFI